MQSRFLVADSTGKIARAGEGHGFALLPGRPAGSATVRPGSFPVKVTTRTGKVIEVVGPHCYYFMSDAAERFEMDCGADAAGEGWNVVTFSDPREGVRGGAGRPRITTRLQSATAVPTAAPVGAVGFSVRPGTQSWNAYAAGTLQLARLWLCDLDGVWTNTLEDLDFSLTPVVGRLVDATGRVYLQAAGVGMTAAVDVTEEVG